MNWEALFPGKYIKSAEFAGKQPTLTITGLTIEDLPDEKSGGTKKRGVLSFKETQKGLVLNRTNAVAFKTMFGAETDGWNGKRVTLWAAPFTDPFTGESITAIRVLGSPDIDGPKSFEAKIGRKSVKFNLKKTAVGKQAAPASVTADGPPPDDVALPGEPGSAG
jgi:hypothetical protein